MPGVDMIPRRVRDILALLDNGIPPDEIPALVGCTISYVYYVRKGYRPQPKVEAVEEAGSPEIIALRRRAERLQGKPERPGIIRRLSARAIARHLQRIDPTGTIKMVPPRATPRKRTRHAMTAINGIERAEKLCFQGCDSDDSD